MADIINSYLDESGQKRLRGIHAKQQSSLETIRAIAKQATGKEVLACDRIVVGEVNEVYLLRFQDRKDMVLRIGHRPDTTFESETWAIEWAFKVGVPAAKVLATGVMDIESKRLSFSLQEKISGERFDTLLWDKKIEPARARRITEEAGQILAKLHGVSTVGYGPVGANGNGEFATIEEWIEHHTDMQPTYKRLFAQHGLGSNTLLAVMQKLGQATQYLSSTTHLLHMDYGPKHILVGDSDEITGVIDFERAESGDPAMDFASWDFWFDKVLPTQWLYEGYKKVRSLGDNYQERLQIAKLSELLYLLRSYTDVAPDARMAANVAQVIKTLVV